MLEFLMLDSEAVRYAARAKQQELNKKAARRVLVSGSVDD
jgi:hypothetical protein